MDRHIRVLIADNQARARDALRALLATIGLDETGKHQPVIEVVGEVGDGSEALQFVQDHQPDVVVMDVEMPELDGLEATRIIKRDFPAVRVVLLTMYSKNKTQARAAGADAFLIKGYSSDELSTAILNSPV
jgi:CheY-like chemotaxis protein